MNTATTDRETGMQPHQTEQAPTRTPLWGAHDGELTSVGHSRAQPTASSPLPGAESSELRIEKASRVRRARDGALLGAVMRFGWARWHQDGDVEEVAVFAPGWNHGWRAGLLRTAWLAPPRTARQQRSVADLTPTQLLLALALFAPLLLIWGPHLNGAITLLGPLVVAWVAPAMLWAAARAATRRRLLIVQGRSPQALALHRVLAAVQQLTIAQHRALLGAHPRSEASTTAETADLGQELAWKAASLVRHHADGACVDAQLAQLTTTAGQLADSTLTPLARNPVPSARALERS